MSTSAAGRLPKRQAVEKPVSKFLCRPRYRFSVPEAPMDLKMKVVKLDLAQYREHQVTSLDSEHVRPLMTDELFGVRINHADTSMYRRYRKGEGLTQADLELVADPDTLSAQGGRDSGSNTAWLRQTTTESKTAVPRDRSRPESLSRPTSAAQAANNDTGDSLASRIERSFKAAARPPVHPTKRRMRPKEIVPLLPNLPLWGSRYALAQFDGDPLAGAAGYDSTAAKGAALSAITIGEKKASGNVLHYYSGTPKTMRKRRRKNNGEDADDEADVDDDDDDDDGEDGGSGEEYGKLDEYSFTVAPSIDDRLSFALSRAPGSKQALFTPLDSTLTLQRLPAAKATQGGVRKLKVSLKQETESERAKREELMRVRLDTGGGDVDEKKADEDDTAGRQDSEARPDDEREDEEEEGDAGEEDGDDGNGEDEDEDEDEEDEEDEEAASARKAAMAAELESDSE